MMATSRKLRDRSDARKDLREHSNPYKRRYTSTQELGRGGKPGTFDQVNRILDRKYQERQSLSDENNEAEERQGEDGQTEANRQEGGVGDQILRFHQAVDGMLKVLVDGFRKDNEYLKNETELQNSEYVNQVEVLKDQNETLTNQVKKKTTECGEIEEIGAQLKREADKWKKKFVDCAVKSLKNETELQNSEYVNQVAVLKDQNETLTNQVKKKTTECGEIEEIGAQLKREADKWKKKFVDCAVKSLKNETELQNSEYVNQVAVLKDQNETLTNQVKKKTTECGEIEQIGAQLKSEAEKWKSKFVDCAVKLGREIEAHRKENETLRKEKDSFKEENDSLKRKVEKSNTECAQVGQIAAQLNKTFELLRFEFVKHAELKNQNKLLEDQLAKWKTDCEKEAQARKDLESELTAFWTKLGIATPPSTS